MRLIVFFSFFFLLLILSSCFVKLKTLGLSDSYFIKNKMYYYNTLYIDAEGDTIIKGEMIIKPLDRPWIGQWKSQESVNYIYTNDTVEYIKYKDPEPYFFQKQQKYLKKHKYLKMKLKEKTGGSLYGSIFYIHPPRINQFRMLFYSAHPSVNYIFLQDTVVLGISTMSIFGVGKVINNHRILPLKQSSIQSVENNVKVWEIIIESKCEFTNKSMKNSQIYNSRLDAEFCKEYGFVKMHYTFENGIKIQFDFVKMTVE